MIVHKYITLQDNVLKSLPHSFQKMNKMEESRKDCDFHPYATVTTESALCKPVYEWG